MLQSYLNSEQMFWSLLRQMIAHRQLQEERPFTAEVLARRLNSGLIAARHSLENANH